MLQCDLNCFATPQQTVASPGLLVSRRLQAQRRVGGQAALLQGGSPGLLHLPWQQGPYHSASWEANVVSILNKHKVPNLDILIEAAQLVMFIDRLTLSLLQPQWPRLLKVSGLLGMSSEVTTLTRDRTSPCLPWNKHRYLLLAPRHLPCPQQPSQRPVPG